MGQLVVAAAGAAIGSVIPGVGTAIGWSIGSVLGSVLFQAPDKVQRVQGPTLNDGRFYGAEYGRPNTWGLGSFQNAGQFIWNSDKIPTVSVTSQSEGVGKGDGPETTTITETTTYHIDALLLLNDTISAGVPRAWDNGKLIYNALSGASGDTLIASGASPVWESIAFYGGDPAQLPDPDYEAAVGVGHAPAYRNRATLFIKGLKLGQAPAPVRNITWEVMTSATVTSDDEAWVSRTSAADNNWLSVAYGDGLFVAVAASGSGNRVMTSPDGVTWTSRTSAANSFWISVVYASGLFVAVAGDGHPNQIMTSPDGITWTSRTTPVSKAFSAIAYGGGRFVAVAGSATPSNVMWSTDGFSWTSADAINGNSWSGVAYGNGTFVAVAATGTASDRVMTSPDGATWAAQESTADSGWQEITFGNGTFVAIGLNAVMTSPDGVTWTARTPASATPQWIGIDYGNGLFVATANTNSPRTMFSADGITWTGVSAAANLDWRDVAFGGGRFVAVGASGTGNRVMTWDGSIIPVITDDPISYEEATTAVLERSGYVDGTDFDVSDLSSITRPMRSLPVTQVGPGRAPLDLLAVTGFFDVYCTDKIYAVPRGGASVVTIPFEDLGAGMEGETVEPLEWRMVNDMESPAFRSITYRNIANDYLVDTKMSDRLTSTLANTVRNDTIPMGFLPAEAKEIVDVWANDQVNSLLSATISVLGDYAYLEPSNIITVTDRDSSTFRCRVTKIEDVYPVLKLDIVMEHASITSTPAITDEDYEESSVVNGLPLTDLELLDIPILSDTDAASGAPYVAARGATDTPWPGMVLYQSSNGVDYTPIASLSSESGIGTCTTTLGAWTGARVFDERNSVRVNVGEGNTLTSSTRDLMLASQAVNACVIGSELLQFRDATVVSDGVYDLTGFLRGSRGTEWAMASHGASERFVLLTASTITRFTMANSQLGVSFDYKAVTAGKTLSSATAEAFTCGGIAFKPFSPVNARCSRDGSNNATVTWQRRTRLSVRMIGELGISVPLGEGTEAYEIDVYTDDTFTTLARATPLTATSETVAYSAAEQTSDSLTPGDPLNLGIRMISTVVGDGYELQATV